MVNSVGALRSLTRLGVTFLEGVGELMDNAIDAHAKRVLLLLEVDRATGRLRMVVVDDGVGIPTQVEGAGVSKTVQYALRFGGKMRHEGRPYPVGRFGLGMSQTATCLTSRTEVYSKVEGGQWRSCYYDFEELLANDVVLPEEVDQAPQVNAFVDALAQEQASGTVIVMDGIVKAGYSEPRHLENLLRRELGRIYRLQISSGLAVHIEAKASGEADWEGFTANWNDHQAETQVIARDPMAQIPSSYEAETFGVQPTRAEVTLTFDGEDLSKFPQVIDQVTGRPAEIKVKMVAFDVEHVYESLGIDIQAEATVNGIRVTSRKNSIRLGQHGFNHSEQGFSVIRNGREIRNGQSLGVYTKDNQLNYFRGTVSFPSCLDDLFSVQVIKGRFSLDQRLADLLRDRCSSTINSIRRETGRSRSRARAKGAVASISNAEERSEMLKTMLERPKLSPEKKAKKKASLAEAKKKIIAEVEHRGQQRIVAAEAALAQAKLMNAPATVKASEDRLALAKERLVEETRAIRNRFEHPAFCRKWIKALPGGDLYKVDDYDEEIWVTINSESGFYRSLYQYASQFPEQQALLDLMLFSIAYSEATRSNTEEMEVFWNRIRASISSLAHMFVGAFREFEEDPSDPEEEALKDEKFRKLITLEDFGGEA